jgi:hypothetical protein
MMDALCEIISFEGANKFLHQGLLFSSKNSHTTVIHVHGSCGNFISFKPIKKVAESYVKNGINLLTFNTRGHDCITEGFWSNSYDYVGGSITSFDDCIIDIQSAIDFCLTFSSKIILQGHSLGCDRVIQYQLKSKQFYPTILISPCDSYALHSNFLKKRGLTVEKHLQIIKKYKHSKYEFLPLNEYGVDNRGEIYYVPITRDTLLSIMTGAPFKLFRIDKPLEYYLPVDCFACIGQYDKLQTHPSELMFSHLGQRFMSLFKLYVHNADHEIEPNVELLNSNLIKWIADLEK